MKRLRKVNRMLDLVIVETSVVDNPANDMALMESVEMAKAATAKAEFVVIQKAAGQEPLTLLGRVREVPPEPVAVAVPELSGAQRISLFTKLTNLLGITPTPEEMATLEAVKREANREPEKALTAAELANQPGEKIGKTTLGAFAVERGWTEEIGKSAGANLPEDVKEIIKRFGWTEGEALSKGMYGVSELARLISDLTYVCSGAMYERNAEGDSSTVPDQLNSVRDELGLILIAMATEEVAELKSGGEISMALSQEAQDVIKLFAQKGGAAAKDAAKTAEAKTVDLSDPAVLEIIGKAVEAEVEKRGAQHSAATLKVAQDVHDKLHDMCNGQSDDDDQKAIIAENVLKAQEAIPEAVREGVIEYVKRGRFSKKDHAELGSMHDAVRDHFKSDCKVSVKADAPDFKKFAEDMRGELSTALKESETRILTAITAKMGSQPEPLKVNPSGITLLAIDKDGKMYNPQTGELINKTASPSNTEPQKRIEITDPRQMDSVIAKSHQNEAGRVNVTDLLN